MATPEATPVEAEAPPAPKKGRKPAAKPTKVAQPDFSEPAPKAKGKAKVAAPEPTPIVEVEGDYELVDVDGSFYMVHKPSQKAYRADLNHDGDERALLDQCVGVFQEGEILPVFDDEDE